MGAILQGGETLDRFIANNKSNGGLLRGVWDTVRSVADTLTGTQKQNAQVAEAKLTDAINNVNLEKENTAQTDGERYYIGEDRVNGVIDTAGGKTYNKNINRSKKYKKISNQAWSQIQRERMLRYGGSFGEATGVDYFYAHDNLFVLENFDESNFGVIDVIDPGKNQSKANLVEELFENASIEYASEYSRRFENLRRWKRRNAGNTLLAKDTGTRKTDATVYAEYGRTGDGNATTAKSGGVEPTANTSISDKITTTTSQDDNSPTLTDDRGGFFAENGGKERFSLKDDSSVDEKLHCLMVVFTPYTSSVTS